MNEHDLIRHDLQADADLPYGAPDLDAIMRTGRGLRRRRTATAVSAAALVLVTVTGVALTIDRPTAGNGTVTPVADAPSVVTTTPESPPPTPEPTRATAAPIPEQNFRTGLQLDGGGELVMRVHAVEHPQLPQTRFGIAACRLDSGGATQVLIVTNETDVSDVAPGFHAIEAPMNVKDTLVPEFGYYAGPAERITGVVPGAGTVEAGTAVAKVAGTMIVLFWFDPAVTGPEPVADLRALDENGKDLPGGDTRAGRG
ncbi:hypothetical protein [Catenuloplanes japonicus]|uniref:hypothetical protein n=1 Tax=Catenuloplanes japonicus TaxID=33876 RepID=UPI00068B9551|nr:hypothetical protein [Catenuloplanes japonicus]